MIKSVHNSEFSTRFCSKSKKEKAQDETRILPDTVQTKLNQDFQKTTSAFLDYPIKGFKGDINSNFYEFLTMGIVPYLAGSIMFMVAFNCLNKVLGREVHSSGSKKVALGVVFYGLMKSISKNLVTKPIKWATGVDIDMPYQNKVYNLPKEAGENANIDVQYQQRKIFDSKEFFRKDLLDKTYFDNVAKKLGLGTNLNDSVSETTPIIQNIVATSNTAKSLSSYAWAAVGVGIAMQNSWDDFFKFFSTKPHGKGIKNFGKDIVKGTKTFGKSFIDACKTLWTGNNGSSGYMKHAGKGLILLASALTIGLTANSILRAKSMAKNKNIKTIDDTKESTVI